MSEHDIAPVNSGNTAHTGPGTTSINGFNIPLPKLPLDLNTYPFTQDECRVITESAQILADKVGTGGVIGVLVGVALTYPKRFSRGYKLWSSVTGFCAGSYIGHAYAWNQMKPKLQEVKTPLIQYVLTKQIPMQIIVPVIHQKFPNSFSKGALGSSKIDENENVFDKPSMMQNHTDFEETSGVRYENGSTGVGRPSYGDVHFAQEQSSASDTIVARAQRRKERLENALDDTRHERNRRRVHRRNRIKEANDSDDENIAEHNVEDMHNDFDYGNRDNIIQDDKDDAVLIMDKYDNDKGWK